MELRNSLLNHKGTAIVDVVDNHGREDDEPADSEVEHTCNDTVDYEHNNTAGEDDKPDASAVEHNDRLNYEPNNTAGEDDDPDDSAVEHNDRVDYEPNNTTGHGSFKIVIAIVVVLCIIGVIIVITVAIVCRDGCLTKHYNTSNSVSSHANASGITSTSERETCIFNTPKKLLEKLKEDPLKDKCNKESTYVKDYCKKSGTSTQHCKSCGSSGTKLPDFCFCDKQQHCNPYDDPLKTSCNDCKDYFENSPYKDRGNCICPPMIAVIKIIECSCHEGFANDMCSTIEKRFCESSKKKMNGKLANCKESNDETCVFTRSDGTEFICNVFSAENRKFRNEAGVINNCR